jgi:lysophospholipase L1-like esterase
VPATTCFGSNDAAPWKAVAVPDFVQAYRRLLSTLPGRVLVLGLPPVVDEEGGRTSALVAQYAAATAQVAPAFVPLHAALDRRHLAEDGLHLNDAGYEVVARLVVDAIG